MTWAVILFVACWVWWCGLVWWLFVLTAFGVCDCVMVMVALFLFGVLDCLGSFGL